MKPKRSWRGKHGASDHAGEPKACRCKTVKPPKRDGLAAVRRSREHDARWKVFPRSCFFGRRRGTCARTALRNGELGRRPEQRHTEARARTHVRSRAAVGGAPRRGGREPPPFPLKDMHNHKVTRSANPRGSPSGTPQCGSGRRPEPASKLEALRSPVPAPRSAR